MIDIDKLKQAIINNFPFESFRGGQDNIMLEVIKSFNKKVEVYLLNGYVGFGKSPVGIGLGRMSESCYYATPQKSLQTQLARDFDKYINVIKGRNAYICKENPKVDCKNGRCQFDKKFKCPFDCQYVVARERAIAGKIACTNFSYLLSVPDFLFSDRQLLIIDEVHSVDSWALNFVSCTIYRQDLFKAGASDITIPVFRTFDEYIKWLTYIKYIFGIKLTREEQELEDIAESGEIVLGLKESVDRSTELVRKLDNILDDYELHGEEWIWQTNDLSNSKTGSITFQPITSGRFLDKLIWWRGKYKLLMSGTIFPELFIKDAGLDNKVCVYRELKSTFPVENRPIYFWATGKMSLRHRTATLSNMADRIAVIMSKNEGKNGFAHCGSYDIADAIYGKLHPIYGDKIKLQSRFDRDGSFNEWIDAKEPSLFLSVNRTEGVDLVGELCAYQIICKIQFPYLGSKRIKARMEMKEYMCLSCGKVKKTATGLTYTTCKCGGKFVENMVVDVLTCKSCGLKYVKSQYSKQKITKCNCGHELTKRSKLVDGNYWYNMQPIIDIEQAYGRGVRSDTDTAQLWILDSSFKRLYFNFRSSFSIHFKEALQVIE